MYRVPLAQNTIGRTEMAAVNDVLKSGRLTQGAAVEEFENAFAKWVGTEHAIMVNSGSSANLIAIEAAIYLSRLIPEWTHRGPIEAGDEVVIQGLNWPSTLKPILNHGLTPVFCDVDLKSLNAGVDQVAAAVSERTRMLIAVPVLGNPTHLDHLRSYCKDRDILLVEDACESLGARTESGEYVGRVGIASAFSFYFSHHLTTIEGGAILTSDHMLAEVCYALRSHGWTRDMKSRAFFDSAASRVDERFCFMLPGYNVRSTEINAAIGSIQLRGLESALAARRTVARRRISGLTGLANIVEVPGREVVDRHSWMTFPMMFDSKPLRNQVRNALENAGVETRPIIVGNVLRQPLVKYLPLSDRQRTLPTCDEVFERGLMIGLDPQSDEETDDFIANCIRSAVRD